MRLVDHLPDGPRGEEHHDPDATLAAFTDWVEGQGLTLYDHQEEALLEVLAGSHVILATPTGSGKSLVAAGAQLAALAAGRRTFYTAPIKALVSEKFFALVDLFGADDVGMMTGDATVNPGAPVIAATAEIVANLALREGADADVGLVVMDEFHYYADPDRGWAWQVPLLELTRTQFVLMSATIGDPTFFADDLTRRTGRETATVTSVERPVPLVHEYVTTPVHETIEELVGTHQAPVYVVHFSQAAAVERAQALASANVTSKDDRERIREALGAFRFTSGFGTSLSRLVRLGVGVHHAGMLPRYRRLVETLTQAGLLTVVCGTDTLGVGINVPIRTVLFTALTKYDGTRQRHLQVREFQQIAGRAGRAGFDTVGRVVVEAPDHVVENAKQLAKAGDDPKKRRKVTRKKAPEGFVNWTESTYERLTTGQPEPLVSRMKVSHAMLLEVVSRPGDAFAAMRHLLRDNHEPRARQNQLVREAIAIYRSLLAGGVVERLDEPDAEGRTVRLTVDLPPDFALDQPLSAFAVAALDVLDPDSPDHALDVVSVMESTLDDPVPVLRAQKHRARGAAVAEMKADGVEYEERMELLDDVEHPQPLREELEAAYEAYRSGQPWVADHRLRPKSVAREMWERSMTFPELISFHGLARSEGLVLRYLTDVYKALRRTVPASARSELLEDLTAWLGEVVRQTDSSLLDEWEQLVSGGGTAVASPEPLAAAPTALTQNARAFRVLVRNAMFRRVELAALRRWEELGALDSAAGWTATRWSEAMTAYFAEYDGLGTGPDARGPAFFRVEEDPEGVEGRAWVVEQVLADPDADGDWRLVAEVDLDASDETGEPAVRLRSVGPL